MNIFYNKLIAGLDRQIAKMKAPNWIDVNDSYPTEKGWYRCTCYDPEIWSGDGIVRDLYWYPGFKEFVDNIRYETNCLNDIENFFWTKYVIAWKPVEKPYTRN